MNQEIRKAANRIEWIDLARGLGVILVILGHMDLGDGITWFIYSFHMPLFFFLSGLVFRVRPGERFRDFAARKAKALLIPYVLLGIPLLLSEWIKEIYAGSFTAQSAIHWILRFFLQQRLWTLWFLTSLFLLELVMYPIAHIRHGRHAAWIRLAVAALLSAGGIAYCTLCGVCAVWDADMALCAALWFEAGYELRLAGGEQKMREMTSAGLLAAGVLGLLVNLVCSYVSKETTGLTLMMSYNNYGQPLCTYLGAFGGILMTLAAAALLARHFGGAKHRPLTYIGQNTWIYFAWNQTILLPLINWILGRVGFDAGIRNSAHWILHRSLEFAFVLAVSTLCTVLVNAVKNTRKRSGKSE